MYAAQHAALAACCYACWSMLHAGRCCPMCAVVRAGCMLLSLQHSLHAAVHAAGDARCLLLCMLANAACCHVHAAVQASCMLLSLKLWLHAAMHAASTACCRLICMQHWLYAAMHAAVQACCRLRSLQRLPSASMHAAGTFTVEARQVTILACIPAGDRGSQSSHGIRWNNRLYT